MSCKCFILPYSQERNKPKEPPKKPKAAPFFLPTVGGLETKFDITQSNEDDDEVSFHLFYFAIFF